MEQEFNREEANEERARISYVLHKEKLRCFHCGNGHKKMHKDKVKVNGKPEYICEDCFKIFQDKE